MAVDMLMPVVQFLHRVTAPAQSAGISDAELLERFAGRRDQAAFAALVQRHGPMVMGVCRRLLRDRHEAEDAWQATFLILVRKAGAIARRELLAGWLYGVAYRTARRARRVTARRRARERPAGEVMAPMSAPADVWPDLRPLLDEEIQRLPEKYRLPVILCYFESKTNTEAARLLNCPRGTIATRLARARERLRVRLTRRGVTLSAGGVALALSQEAVPAAVPGILAEATLRAGWLLATGVPAVGEITARAAVLAQGGMRVMAMAKLKVAALILAVSAVGSGSGLVACRMCASENAPEKSAQKVEEKAPLPAAPAAKSDPAGLEERIYAALRKDRCWKPTDLPCKVWVRDVKERVLIDTLFKRYDSDGVAQEIARAREAEVRVDLGQQKVLIHARHVYELPPRSRDWAYFAERVFTIPLAPVAAEVPAAKQTRKPREGALISILDWPAPLSLMGERLDPPGEISLSCDGYLINTKFAAFRGRVRAIQGTTSLECDEFRVIPEQPIANVGDVAKRGWKECRCTKDVCLEDRVREGGRLVHFMRLVAPSMTIGGDGEPRDVGVERRDNFTYRVTIGPEAGGIRASGPGSFVDLHPAPEKETGAAPATALWRISYAGRLTISARDHQVHLQDRVEVACVPADEPDTVIDRDHLPEGGITFEGGLATFEGQRSAQRRAGRRLIVGDQASFRTAELRGEAGTIIYDEDAGRIVLRADGHAPAVLSRQKDGAAPERITGQEIIYSLKTQEADIIGTRGALVSP